MPFNPFTLYTKAVRAVPAIKYALGATGIVATGAMALAGSKNNPKIAILSFVCIMIGMYLLVVFASVANTVGRWPGIILVWSVTILFVCMLVMTVTALAFGSPVRWAQLVGIVAVPASTPPTSMPSPLVEQPGSAVGGTPINKSPIADVSPGNSLKAAGVSARIVAPPASVPFPVVEQTGNAVGGILVNAAPGAEVVVGKARKIASASATSVTPHSIKQSGYAGPGGVVINADGAIVEVDTGKESNK